MLVYSEQTDCYFVGENGNIYIHRKQKYHCDPRVKCGPLKNPTLTSTSAPLKRRRIFVGYSLKSNLVVIQWTRVFDGNTAEFQAPPPPNIVEYKTQPQL